MEYIPRILQKTLENRLVSNKVVLIYGSRRVGKTILVKKIMENTKEKTLFLNGEDVTTQRLLEERNASRYRRLLAGYGLLILDEAQSVPDIGRKLKLMVDEIEGIMILATGSSSFDLLNLSGEPLTGRSFHFSLYPFSRAELDQVESILQAEQNLEDRLIFGSYPEILGLETSNEKETYLKELVSSYLLKDVLSIEGIRISSKMIDLLKLLAFQIGGVVSFHELGSQLSMSKNTVEKYIDLLSKVFILFKMGSFSRNLRKEISKSRKFYFWDNGIRNAILGDFRPLSLRQDTGLLWENYFIMERMKRSNNLLLHPNYYFWRTFDGQEIDLIEEEHGSITAFECKWTDQGARPPRAFKNAYPEAAFKVIDRRNYLDWL
ncbi:MAG: ATP-binding protein [Bacteroidetes bacterium]|nr:ATP-binding protein [Bacteroidota bacterium]